MDEETLKPNKKFLEYFNYLKNIVESMNALIDKGYILFDAEKQQMNKLRVDEEKYMIYEAWKNTRYVIFGLGWNEDMTKSEMKRYFKNVTGVHPSNFLTLKELLKKETKMNKTTYITELAAVMKRHNMKMTSTELVSHLNNNGITPNRGGKYQANTRGIFKVIGVAYRSWPQTSKEADNIANVFVNDNGEFVYE